MKAYRVTLTETTLVLKDDWLPDDAEEVIGLAKDSARPHHTSWTIEEVAMTDPLVELALAKLPVDEARTALTADGVLMEGASTG